MSCVESVLCGLCIICYADCVCVWTVLCVDSVGWIVCCVDCIM